MPEYPDIIVYIEALEKRIVGRGLKKAQINSHFLLRTYKPSMDQFIGKRIEEITRMGKRIVIKFGGSGSDEKNDPLWMVFHLMIEGRLHWKINSEKKPGKNALIILEFENGFLYMTEPGKKKRASLHLFDSEEELRKIDPRGLEVLETDLETFIAAFTASSHTLKRALTDPHILSGIGNSYSDEILHKAGLSPIAMTKKLTSEELERLYESITACLKEWTARLKEECGEGFPEKVTAFRPEMAVHGRFDQPCPVCGSPVQRIQYSLNETDYCPVCQTDGKVLADRSLSRLLKNDWPRTMEELENMRNRKNE